MPTRQPPLPVLDPESTLPPLYAPWIEEILCGPPPTERHATCGDCAMCQPIHKAATARAAPFDPAAKCCTYVPTLPNFLVGRILRDSQPTAAAGRSSVEQRIAEGVGVTPLGLQPDPKYALIYRHAGKHLFGRTPGLRCPHYLPSNGGQCGIWGHRNAICSTYFCKFERGAAGQSFWTELAQLLTAVERHLALWCASELGEPIEGLGPALLPYYVTKLDSRPCAWSQRWDSRRKAFYQETACMTESLTWSRVREVAGLDVDLLADRLRASHAELRAASVPEYLRLAPVAATAGVGDIRMISGYSTTDMLLLPAQVLHELRRFDGQRPTGEVCQEVMRNTNVKLDLQEVRRLVDFGLLVPMPTLQESIHAF